MTKDFNYDSIPPELKKLKQWVVYKLIDNKKPNGKLDKEPYQINGSKAKCNDPKTWTDFETAKKFAEDRHFDGIGFEFVKGGGYCGIDLDHSIKGNEIEDWAQKWIDCFSSYTEYSPSHEGVHIIIKGVLPAKGRKDGNFECYDQGRFFTFTGNIVNESLNTIKESNGKLQQFIVDVFGEERKDTKVDAQGSGSTSLLSDEEILEKATKAENADKFNKLFAGDFSNYPSQSEGDIALCSMLAFWAQNDSAAIDRLFRLSKLYRKKWDEKHGTQTYGQMTIGLAISGNKNVYKKPEESNYFKRYKTDKEAIADFDSKYALIQSGDSEPVFDLKYKDFFSVSTLERMYQSTYPGIKEVKGKNQDIPKSAFTAWVYGTHQRYHGLKFSPGCTASVIYENERPFLNLWTGYAVKPQEGSNHILWLNLLQDVICDQDKVLYDYCLTYFAQMVQSPANRQDVALVLRSDAQGLGKGLLMRWIAAIFGAHYQRISHSEHLVGKFNKHFMNNIITFVDEGFWAGDKAGRGTLYGMVTEPTIKIEPKGHDAFDIENHVHFVFASNNAWVIPAEMDARRFAVIDVPSKNKQSDEYYEELVKNLNIGASHLLHYLLHYDISKVNLRHIPKNRALLDQKILNLSGFNQFIYERLQGGVLFVLLPKLPYFKTDYPHIDADVDWEENPIEIVKQDLLHEYRLWNKETSQRDVSSEDQVGKKMHKLIGAENGRLSSGIVRPYTWKVPSLDNARETFAKGMGQAVEWAGETQGSQDRHKVDVVTY